jgi:23S rRNA-/tRNA-specific pseudouridylate synthase
MEIVYEDNHLIIVNKSASEIVQGDKTGDESLVDKLKAYIKEAYAKPGEVFLGTVHRLDRPVSGLVVFAKTSKALSRMNDMFKNGEVKKTYWAIVKNCPSNYRANSFIGWSVTRSRTRATPTTRRFTAVRKPFSTIDASEVQNDISCWKSTCIQAVTIRYVVSWQRLAVP